MSTSSNRGRTAASGDRTPEAPGFFDGLIDGMLARRFWNPEVAAAPKTVSYILGEIWAMSTQPLALLAAVLDWEALSPSRRPAAPR